MIDTFPLLEKINFPALSRNRLQTLQINLGYLCNQQCLHCHVNAGPNRKEIMARETIDDIIAFVKRSDLKLIDLTGGAPELNPDFRYLVKELRACEVEVMDRCNLTVLEQPGQEGLADFLAANQVQVTASLPCYDATNVDKQRGDGVFDSSIRGLKVLNQLGYGIEGSGLELNLVYNPLDASLPPDQVSLEAEYKKSLFDRWGIMFNHLFTLANMPIKRFGSTLVSKKTFKGYLDLLQESHLDKNLNSVMCLDLISIDWQGMLYDCDFNQMLTLPLRQNQKPKSHISEINAVDLENLPIQVAGHCYACTAGQGSSCGGALVVE